MIHVDGIRVDMEGDSQELANDICLLIISLCEAAEVTVTDFIKDFGGWLDYHGIKAEEVPRGFSVAIENDEDNEIEDPTDSSEVIEDLIERNGTFPSVHEFIEEIVKRCKGERENAKDERSTEEVQDLRQKGNEELDH